MLCTLRIYLDIKIAARLASLCAIINDFVCPDMLRIFCVDSFGCAPRVYLLTRYDSYPGIPSGVVKEVPGVLGTGGRCVWFLYVWFVHQ